MSRVAKSPIKIPDGVDVIQSGELLTVKGKLGEMNMNVHSSVTINNIDNVLTFLPVETSKDEEKDAWAQAGTVRANTFNLIKGVTEGWEKKLTLIGVGYRAQVRGKVLSLTLGFSHPVNYDLPEGVSAETPSQTEVVVKGIDKQKVGQAAAEI